MAKGKHRQERKGKHEKQFPMTDDFDARSAHIREERKKAQDLRKSPWWQSKLQEGICYYCNMKFSPDELTMDHILPLSQGGSSTRSNIVAACKACNTSKKNDLTVDRLDLFK